MVEALDVVRQAQVVVAPASTPKRYVSGSKPGGASVVGLHLTSA